jgi:hypothetical protein
MVAVRPLPSPQRHVCICRTGVGGIMIFIRICSASFPDRLRDPCQHPAS